MVATATTAVFAQESILIAVAHLLVEARVIGERVMALFPKKAREIFGALARGAIDDAAFALVAVEKARKLATRLILGREVQRNVGSVETMQEELRRRGEKPPGDVLARGGVGGGGEADHLNIAEQLGGSPDFAVFGPKIMSPFGDAMRLVDGEASWGGRGAIRR